MADNRGGLPPKSAYGRPVQAPGVGARAKRHDLERRDTPYLQGSDLQYGEVKEMQAGKKQMNARKERRAPQRPQQVAETSAPDPIDFMSNRGMPQFPHAIPNGPSMESWMPLVRTVANSKNASPVLRRLFIRTLRNMQLSPNSEVYHVNLAEIDRAILGE
jgi:hypothetical protein